MDIKKREGSSFPLNLPQQLWVGEDPEIMQTALFAGQEVVAITDDAGAFDLRYMGHTVSGFTSMIDAKSAAPEFTRAVLASLLDLIQDNRENENEKSRRVPAVRGNYSKGPGFP